MKNKKYNYIIYVLLAVSAVLGVSSTFSDIDKTQLIRTVAIDRTSSGVHITASAGTGAQDSKIRIFEGEGKSVAAAIERLKAETTEGNADFSHTEHIIIGEDSTKSGILPQLLDYVSRSTDMRTDIKLYIAKNSTAEKLIKDITSKNNPPADVLSNISEKADMAMTGHTYTCKDVTARNLRHATAMIMAVEERDGKTEATGFAIIKDGIAVAYTDENETRGVCIIENTAEGGSIVTEAPCRLTLDICKISARIVPEISDGEMKGIDLKVSADVGVSELGGAVDLTDEAMRRKIEAEAEKQLTIFCRAAIEKSGDTDTDFLRIGEKCRVMHPMTAKTGGIEYEQAPSKLAVDIYVAVTLKRTYDTVSFMGAQNGK